ncbi:MAG: ribosome biogenesis factor YjgA [Methylotenera sp.]|jgi:ribosome-associated protein
MQQKDENTSLISKTQRKAEADQLQQIGKSLVALPIEKVKQLQLPEALYEAILEAKRISSNGAIRRQMQYIGRLMRDIDPTPIVEQLAKWEGKNQEENARFHALERWRDRLISEAATSSNEALQAFVTQYPNDEIQRLRHLIRNAHHEQSNNKSPKSTRELFKLLRDITENTNQD